MSWKFFILIATLLALVLGSECWLVNHNEKSADEEQCKTGPVYWCKNLRNSKICGTTKHCIDTAWIYRNFPKDNDSICKICTDMVGQARDVLESNSTTELIKEVINGSCHLVPLPVITEECMKLGDTFIDDLVKTLASMMNPNQVCTVAGLCNNDVIDDMLKNYEKAALDRNVGTDPLTQLTVKQVDEDTAKNLSTEYELTCDEYKHNVTTLIAGKFRETKPEKILEALLYWCGEFSSYSDACSSIVLTYFDDFHKYTEAMLSSPLIYDLSGTFLNNFHKHSDDNVETNKDCVKYAVNDPDIPCKLCEQLVLHLREVVIANTTKDEFKQMVGAFCKQTNFEDECLKLVNNYYDFIYTYLLRNLDAEKMCYMMGLCPKSAAKYAKEFSGPIRPLLPVVAPQKIDVTIKKLGRNEPKFTPEEVNAMQLPIDRLLNIPEVATSNIENGEMCIICEYILHFIQENLSTTRTEAEIKQAFATVCDKIAYNFHDKCRQFVEEYSEALTSMLIQYLNPEHMCPSLHMCPLRVTSKKPTCPLCLFAVEQAEEKLKNPKSKKSIREVLEHLCSHIPRNLQAECQDFVDTYANKLISMLIKDMPPEAICVELTLCSPNDSYFKEMGISFEGDNKVDRTTANVNALDYQKALPFIVLMKRNNCLLCEEFVKNVEKDIRNTKGDDMKVLYHICDGYERNNVGIYGKKCRKVVAMILDSYEPKKICEEIDYCLPSEQMDLDIDEAVKYDVIVMPGDLNKARNDEDNELTASYPMNTKFKTPMCLVCDLVMQKLQGMLRKDSTREEIEAAVKRVCTVMPSKKLEGDCDGFMEKYEKKVIDLLTVFTPREVCGFMSVCLMPGLRSDRINGKIISNEVISCALCQSACAPVLSYLKEHGNSSMNSSKMIEIACKNMRPSHRSKCIDFISIYGISILNLSGRDNMTASRICYEMGRCTKSDNGPYIGFTGGFSNSID